jgi:TaqI-like C-terminal specificity domain
LEANGGSRLLEKIRRAGKPLGEYVEGRIYRGIVTGLNEAFVVDGATRARLIADDKKSSKIIKPWLRGRDVKRWKTSPKDFWLCYVGWETRIEEYPAIRKHLNRFRKELMDRPEVKAGRVPWYAMSRYASDYWQEFEQPKIIAPAIEDEVNYASDTESFYSNDKTSIIIPPSVSFLLAILNSQVSWWLTQQTFASKQGGFYEFKPMYVSQIPIPAAPSEKQKSVERLVERVLSAKQRDAGADVSALEREIDELVFALYALTPEEIAIVKSR